MEVIETYEKSDCENCGKYEYLYEIRRSNGNVMLTLCKHCPLELLKAIVER